MPVLDAQFPEDVVATADVNGTQEKCPESAEAAPSTPASPFSPTSSEKHRRLNKLVSRTLVDASFVDSVFISPSIMRPEEEFGEPEEVQDEKRQLKEEEGEEEEPAQEDTRTTQPRRSSRLTTSSSNGASSNRTSENGRKRKSELSKEKRKSAPKKNRRTSMNSTFSDYSDMAMPTLEAADIDDDLDSPGATATADIMIGKETPEGVALAQMLATFMSSNNNENDILESVLVKEEVEETDEVEASMPRLSPPPQLTSCDDIDEDCACNCCRKTEKQITQLTSLISAQNMQISALNRRTEEMVNLLQKLTGTFAEPSPAVRTLKNALGSIGKSSASNSKSLKSSTGFVPITKFRPVTAAEMGSTPKASTSTLPQNPRTQLASLIATNASQPFGSPTARVKTAIASSPSPASKAKPSFKKPRL